MRAGTSPKKTASEHTNTPRSLSLCWVQVDPVRSWFGSEAITLTLLVSTALVTPTLGLLLHWLTGGVAVRQGGDGVNRAG